MLQKIPTPHDPKSILICIHDILDLCQSGWSREIAKNLSDYMIGRFLKYGFDVCIGDNEDELLDYGIENYSHAVIIAAGTGQKLSDRLIFAIEDKCLEEFYLAGHVLDRKEKYFELHHQFYIVNLKTHLELGCPALGRESNLQHEKIKPISLTDDDYISKELKQGHELGSYSGTMHGWNILSVGLTNSKTIIDLGAYIRNNKKYFYYEYDHVFLKESTELFYNQYLCNNLIIPFNSDKLQMEINFAGPVEQYITLGTGINWVENLNKVGFTKSTKVYFTDINPLVLQFMKSMVESWDGEDYMDFYLSKSFIIPNNLPYDYESYIEQNKNQWKNFRDGNPNWKEKWNAIKSLEFEFVSIDYMSEYNFDWFDRGKKTIFNISDMFNHIPGIFQQSVKYRIAAENRFISKLKEKDSSIFLIWSGRSADGLMPYEQLTKSASISEIESIDILKINRPYWHRDDWNTLRPLI